MTWQPIETAPQDGSHLLLFGDIPGTELLGEQIGCVFSGYWNSIDEAWCATVSTWMGPFCSATHWQPLPPPPSPTSTEDSPHTPVAVDAGKEGRSE